MGLPRSAAQPAEALEPRPREKGARSTNTVNALIHLYRGELGRLTTYRVRLDTTTSWAITSTALVTTFGLSNTQIPHATFLFLMFIVYFFLQLEARRFRAYETARLRVQLLEHYFYPEVLGREVDPAWIDQLVEALRTPSLTVNRLGAIAWRLRRNYLWIYTAVLAGWAGKLYLAGDQGLSLGELGTRAAVGPASGWVVLALVGVFYASLLVIGLGARRIYPLGDDETRHLMEEPGE
jgi:uncharacterized membrane protein